MLRGNNIYDQMSVHFAGNLQDLILHVPELHTVTHRPFLNIVFLGQSSAVSTRGLHIPSRHTCEDSEQSLSLVSVAELHCIMKEELNAIIVIQHLQQLLEVMK